MKRKVKYFESFFFFFEIQKASYVDVDLNLHYKSLILKSPVCFHF